jgi:hypothetical protein
VGYRVVDVFRHYVAPGENHTTVHAFLETFSFLL